MVFETRNVFSRALHERPCNCCNMRSFWNSWNSVVGFMFGLVSGLLQHVLPKTEHACIPWNKRTCHDTRRVEVSLRFMSCSNLMMLRHAFNLYVTAPPQSKWRVGGCAHWKFCVCPSLVSRFLYPLQTQGYEVTGVKLMWNQCELCQHDKDVKHNHMYDVQQVQPSDYPSTAKAENKCVCESFRQVSFRRFSFLHVCALPRGREWVSLL